jgi:predicted Zn finger-like uncharacterized protein
MDVRCERCSTEYEFDDALVSDKGTTVKCMSCGHQFRVQRPSALKAPDKWLVRRPDGEELVFVSLRELQKAIAAQQVGKDDHLFRGALRARALGSIPELQPFFERATRPSTKATSRGLGLPPPAGATPASAPLPSMNMTQPFTLNAPGTLRPPAALPPMTEPMPPITPASPATPLPPPRASSPPAVQRTPPPPANVAKSAPPPVVTQPLRSAPPPPHAPTPALPAVKSAPPPILKSAPPPPIKTPTPPKPIPTPVPARTEALPPMTASVPDDPQTEPIVAPPERPAKPRPAASDPPARAAASDRPTARTRSVPPDLDSTLPVRRDPGITRWIVAGGILGLTALLAGTIGRQYVSGLSPNATSGSATAATTATPPGSTTTAAAAASGPAVAELLASANKSLADGDLEGAKDTLVRASALAPQDANVLGALARVAATKADVAWLRLRLLPKTATDARRIASTELADAAKRAKSAADATAAIAPDSLDVVRFKIDALRLADDVAGARALTSRLLATTLSPENALALGSLDLATDEAPSATTLERLRLATTADGGAGRARALLVFALARAGDAENASKELERLAALPRPHALLPELRALVAGTKQTASTAPPSSGAAPVDIGKLPTVVPVAQPKADDTGYKINDAPPAKPDVTAATPPATATPPTTATTAPTSPKGEPKPQPPKGGKSEFSEEELHRKLFGDQPK